VVGGGARRLFRRRRVPEALHARHGAHARGVPGPLRAESDAIDRRDPSRTSTERKEEESLVMTQSVPGNFIWYDYLASDAEAAIAFYGHLVGWMAQPIQQGYTMFVGSQGPQAGTIGMPEEVRKKGAPPHWSS